MINPIIKKIYRKIKEYDEIVIARHVGPDPDAVTTEIALRDSIKETFPNKKVYAVGSQVSRFKIYGNLDRVDESTLTNALLIVVDVPNISRIDGATFEKYKEVIKIDHHPFEDKMGEVEWVDATSCSTAQLVAELILDSKLKITYEIAANLFCGIVSDSDRFLLSYTTSKSFSITSRLIDSVKLDFTNLYPKLYERPIEEIRFQGYLAQNLNVTENGFAYLKISTEDINKFNVDSSTASNMVNNFNFIKGIYAWSFITYDAKNDIYKVNIRSRGPIINEVASRYNGGGHIYASGARVKTMEEIDNLIKDLDEVCKIYKNDKKLEK